MRNHPRCAVPALLLLAAVHAHAGTVSVDFFTELSTQALQPVPAQTPFTLSWTIGSRPPRSDAGEARLLLPPQAALVSTDCPVEADGNTLLWPFDDLPVGSLSCSLTVRSTGTGATTLEFAARIDPGPGAIETQPEDNEAQLSVAVRGTEADMATSLQVIMPPRLMGTPGGEQWWDVAIGWTASNAGPHLATDAVAILSVLPGLTLLGLDCDAPADEQNRRVWQLGGLDAGSELQCRALLTAPLSTELGQVSASVTAGEPDPVPGNNLATLEIPFGTVAPPREAAPVPALAPSALALMALALAAIAFLRRT